MRHMKIDMAGKSTILLLIVSIFALMAPACSQRSSSGLESPLAPTVAAVPVPLQAAGWEGMTLHKVGLAVEESYDPDAREFHSNYGAMTARYILAGLGVQVVETPPYDAAITIVLKGEASAVYYGEMPPPEYKWSDTRVLSYEVAEVHADVTIVTQGHEALTVQDYFTVGPPAFIENARSLGEAPMNEALAPALLECFSELWGEQVFVDALGVSDPVLRRGSARSLCQRDTDTKPSPALVSALVRVALGDESEKTRLFARDALKVMGPRAYEAIPALIQGMADSDISVRMTAQDIFFSIGPEAVPALIQALQHESELVRQSAVEVLKRFGAGTNGVVPALGQALQDKHYMVRSAAILALSEMNLTEVAISALVEALQSENEEVRQDAAKYLGQYYWTEAKQVVPILVEALKDENHNVAREAAYSLGKIRPEASEAVPALIEAMLRGYTNEAHGQVDIDYELVGVLRDIAGSAEVAVPVLVEALRDEDEKMREEAARALSKIGPEAKEAVPALIQALYDKDGTVFWHAAEALGQIGPDARQAVPTLIDKLEHARGADCEVFAQALKAITKQDFGTDATRWRSWWEKQQ